MCLHTVVFVTVLHTVVFVTVLHSVVFVTVLHTVVFVTVLHIVVFVTVWHIVVFVTVLHIVVFVTVLLIVVFVNAIYLWWWIDMFHTSSKPLILGSPQAQLLVVRMLCYVKDTNQPRLPTPFYSVLVPVSVFMALSTLFHSINSPNNSSLSHSILLVLILLCWSFQLYISLWKSPSALMQSFVVDWA